MTKSSRALTVMPGRQLAVVFTLMPRACQVAVELGVPFIMARKQGKMPNTISRCACAAHRAIAK
eukprot:6206881-Pleurochrysis_carterae.AAC.1